jgi:hypothetical protein
MLTVLRSIFKLALSTQYYDILDAEIIFDHMQTARRAKERSGRPLMEARSQPQDCITRE